MITKINEFKNVIQKKKSSKNITKLKLNESINFDTIFIPEGAQWSGNTIIETILERYIMLLDEKYEDELEDNSTEPVDYQKLKADFPDGNYTNADINAISSDMASKLTDELCQNFVNEWYESEVENIEEEHSENSDDIIDDLLKSIGYDVSY